MNDGLIWNENQDNKIPLPVLLTANTVRFTPVECGTLPAHRGGFEKLK